MRRIRVMAEAQPIDPVVPSVLYVDSRESDARPSTTNATAVLVPTKSRHSHGNVRDVNVVVLRSRWTIEDLADEIALGALAAAEGAGLEVDLAELRLLALAAARREVGPMGWFRRWFA